MEAGPRTRDKRNPEECNRIATDHLSDILFCPDSESLANLQREGLGDKAYMTGDIMYDTYLSISGRMAKDDMPADAEEIVLMTWHRQENTADKERMACILDLVERLESKVVCPLHPRTRKCLAQFGLLERALPHRMNGIPLINRRYDSILSISNKDGVSCGGCTRFLT